MDIFESNLIFKNYNYITIAINAYKQNKNTSKKVKTYHFIHFSIIIHFLTTFPINQTQLLLSILSSM